MSGLRLGGFPCAEQRDDLSGRPWWHADERPIPESVHLRLVRAQRARERRPHLPPSADAWPDANAEPKTAT